MLLALPLSVLLLAAPGPTPLRFADLLVTRPGGQLELAPKLKALVGQRVRIVGFMAKMEVAPAGAFYLVPRPLTSDESGGGGADLPPDAIRVVVRSAKGQPLDHIPRALDVTGTLELGRRDEPDGLPSQIRIVLDAPPRSQKGTP
jgi:hypothetical protein